MHRYDRSFMAAVYERAHRTRNKIIWSFLLKRLFMPPQHSRQYTPSYVPNPSLRPGILDVLVRPRIDVGSVSAFQIHRFFLDSFALFRYLIDELMIWTGSLVFTLSYDSSLRNMSLLVIALRPFRFRLRLLLRYTEDTERSRWGFCFCVRLQVRLKLERLFMLPPPIRDLIPLAVPDTLLDPALSNDFARVFLKSTISDTYARPIRTRICIPDPPPLFFYLSRELFARK